MFCFFVGEWQFVVYSSWLLMSKSFMGQLFFKRVKRIVLENEELLGEWWFFRRSWRARKCWFFRKNMKNTQLDFTDADFTGRMLKSCFESQSWIIGECWKNNSTLTWSIVLLFSIFIFIIRKICPLRFLLVS